MSDTSKAPKPVKAEGEAAKPERFIAASESRFETSVEYRFPTVAYVPESGTPLEHLTRPEYWASIRALRPGVRIWVHTEDETYCAELLVRKTGQGFAKVQVLRHFELDQPTPDPKLGDDHEIEHRGPIVKHRIVRKKDGQVLKQGLDTFEEAQAWLRDHKRMLANR